MQFQRPRFDAPLLGLLLVAGLVIGCSGFFAMALTAQTASLGQTSIVSTSETFRQMETARAALEARVANAQAARAQAAADLAAHTGVDDLAVNADNK